MANLHNYLVRQQSIRIIQQDARSKNVARDQAELNALQMGGTDRAISKGNVALLQENVGVDDNPAKSVLNSYAVEVIIRRNISMEAEGKSEAREYSKDEQYQYSDTVPNSVVTQRIQLIRSNTGVT